MEKLFEQYKDYFEEVAVSKGQILSAEGDIASHLYFVDSGVLRLWHNADGEDITLQFFTEGQWVASFESFYQQLPSLFSLEAVTDGVVYGISYAQLQELLSEEPALKDQLFSYILGRFSDYMSLFLSRIKLSPEERYAELLDLNPELLDRVPHYMIASYLGVTPVSLSRIRKRFSN